MKFLIACILLTSCLSAQHFIEHPEFKQLFDSCNVKGSIFIKKAGSDTIICYNKGDYHRGTLPASTFKICNSLIGLETGVIPDENYVIPWDSVQRSFPAWNRDHNLASAIKYSVVPYYQELARRVGAARMQAWMNRAGYGNKNIGGGIDRFWLSGSLRISPAQQIQFLEKLYFKRLPFSTRSMDIVKKIIINGRTADYTLSAKTGWATTKTTDIGWWVGYIEMKEGTYFFALRIHSPVGLNENFIASRTAISRKIFAKIFGYPFDASKETL